MNSLGSKNDWFDWVNILNTRKDYVIVENKKIIAFDVPARRLSKSWSANDLADREKHCFEWNISGKGIWNMKGPDNDIFSGLESIWMQQNDDLLNSIHVSNIKSSYVINMDVHLTNHFSIIARLQQRFLTDEMNFSQIWFAIPSLYIANLRTNSSGARKARSCSQFEAHYDVFNFSVFFCDIKR